MDTAGPVQQGHAVASQISGQLVFTGQIARDDVARFVGSAQSSPGVQADAQSQGGRYWRIVVTVGENPRGDVGPVVQGIIDAWQDLVLD